MSTHIHTIRAVWPFLVDRWFHNPPLRRSMHNLIIDYWLLIIYGYRFIANKYQVTVLLPSIVYCHFTIYTCGWLRKSGTVQFTPEYHHLYVYNPPFFWYSALYHPMDCAGLLERVCLVATVVDTQDWLLKIMKTMKTECSSWILDCIWPWDW